MKILFIHGARVVEDEFGQIYTDGCFNMNVWNRYLQFTNDFTVVLRKEYAKVKSVDAKDKYNFMDLSKIKFVDVPDLIKPKSNYFNLKIRHKHNTILKDEVKKADFVILRLPSIAGHAALKYVKRYKKNYAIEAVGDPFAAYWYYGNIQGKILAPIKMISMKRDIKTAENVIYVSNTFMQNRYPNKGYNVGCPDVVLMKPNKEILCKRITKINNMADNEINIGLIGSLDVAYRGHETLLKVGSKLKRQGIKVKINFLGPGNQKNIMHKAILYDLEKEVICAGTLPGGNPVMEWIDNIDILVMPTKQETLGRAVIEAMSRGCPIIGSSETAIGEQIGSDCLANSDDYVKISDIIEKMVKNKEYTMYCACENFYRSFKYTNEQTDIIRNNFYRKVLQYEKD